MKIVTKDDALSFVKKYAEAEPDRTPGARYVNEGDLTAECIVGQILVNELGADPERLVQTYSRFTKGGGLMAPNSVFRDRWNDDHNVIHALPDVVFTDEAVKVLDYAQCVQDNRRGDIPGEPWHSGDTTWADANEFVQKYFENSQAS